MTFESSTEGNRPPFPDPGRKKEEMPQKQLKTATASASSKPRSRKQRQTGTSAAKRKPPSSRALLNGAQLANRKLQKKLMARNTEATERSLAVKAAGSDGKMTGILKGSLASKAPASKASKGRK